MCMYGKVSNTLSVYIKFTAAMTAASVYNLDKYIYYIICIQGLIINNDHLLIFPIQESEF